MTVQNYKHDPGLRPGRFALQRRVFRGAVQGRRSAPPELFDLRILLDTETQARHFILNKNPLQSNLIVGKIGKGTGSDKLDIGREGTTRVEPGDRLNPTQNTDGFVELVDEGKAVIINDSDKIKIFKFAGNKLKGKFIFTRQGQTSDFAVRRSDVMPYHGQGYTRKAAVQPYPYRAPMPRMMPTNNPPQIDTTRVIQVIDRLLDMAGVEENMKERLRAVKQRMGQGEVIPRDIAFVSMLRQRMGISLSDNVPFLFTKEVPHYPYDISSFGKRHEGIDGVVAFCEIGDECPAINCDNKQEIALECDFGKDFGCPIFFENVVQSTKEDFEKFIQDHIIKFSDETLGLIDVPGVQIARTGTWNGEDFDIPKLEKIEENFDKLKGFHDPPVKLGHSENQDLIGTIGEIAFGWPKRVYRKGEELFTDLVDVPSKIAELLKRKAFKKISMELYRNFKDQEGNSVGPTLKAIALLGASTPGIRGMKSIDDVLALYAEEELEDDDGVILVCCQEDTKVSDPVDDKTKDDKVDKNNDDKVVDNKDKDDKDNSNFNKLEEDLQTAQKELAKKQAEIDLLKKNQNSMQDQLTRERVEKFHDRNVAMYDDLLNKGKILPRQKDEFLAMLSAVDAYEQSDDIDVETMFFTEAGFDKDIMKFEFEIEGEEGKKEKAKKSLKDMVVSLFSDIEDQVDLDTKSKDADDKESRKRDKEAVEFLGDALDKKAHEFMEKDEDLDYAEALVKASAALSEEHGVEPEELNC